MTWRYTNFVYNKCDVVTTPSQMMRKELKKHGVHSPIKVISNGVDLSIFHKVSSAKAIKKFRLKNGYLIHFGRISYEKNIEVVLRSFKTVIKSHPSYQLVIAGKGPALMNLRKESRKLGINKNVKFTGFVRDDELVGLLSYAKAFATASTIETQGLAILEAMACGLPVVGADKMAIPELIQNEKNGFLVEPGDYRKMGICLLKLIENNRGVEKMGKNSLAMAKKHSLENAVSELENLYLKQIKFQKKKS
jgi:glycosyltransferase involved in cell wall biosynthesis